MVIICFGLGLVNVIALDAQYGGVWRVWESERLTHGTSNREGCVCGCEG
jgi:hypothetical protein